jgi:predicted Zn-dependent protease
MTPEQIEDHNRTFEQAVQIVRPEIIIQGVQEPHEPTELVRSKLDHALELLSRVIELNPNNWSAMWFVGKIYQRYDDQSTALEWFVRAYNLNPSQVDVSREASLCAMAIGRSEEAISFASRALKARPGDSGLQANLALAFLLAGRLSEARASIKRATTGGTTDKIAETISRMIEHFMASREKPPSKTEDLEEYWKQRRAISY